MHVLCDVCTCIICVMLYVRVLCVVLYVYVLYEYECVCIICVFVNTYYMYVLLCNIDIFVIYNTCILICIIYTHTFSKIITYIRLSDYVLFTHDIYVLCTSYADICYTYVLYHILYVRRHVL